MCIYLGNQNDLKYSSQEHIFPAGLGGMSKLPAKYVSDKFNNYFSKLERLFLRHSILSIPRQIVGSGKRGSLNINKVTKSLINVFKHAEKDLYSLGYIKKGKPFEIPHIVFNKATGEYSAGMDKNISSDDLETFINQLKSFSKLRVRTICFTELKDDFIIGIQNGIEDHYDCFIAGSDPLSHPFNDGLLKRFSKILTSDDVVRSTDSFHIRTHQNATIDDNIFRCGGKIAFNVLEHLTDEEFVMQKEFDIFKQWLLEGSDHEGFAFQDSSFDDDFMQIFPDQSHYVFIFKNNHELVAQVVFYNYFNCRVILSKNYHHPFDHNGFICDWQDKKEYIFMDYLNSKSQNLNS